MTRVKDLFPGKVAKIVPARLATRRANWIEVARNDISMAARSWLLWTLCGLFTMVVLVAVMFVVVVAGAREPELPARWGIDLVSAVVRWFVPLIALLVGCVAVVGERQSGRLRMLLGLPITRREALFGKLLGNVITVSAMIIIGLAFAGVVLWYFYVDFDLVKYVIFVGLMVLYGVIFVCLGVGLSALFQSRARAIGASIGVYVLVTFVWRIIPTTALYLVNGHYPENTPTPWNPPGWFVFLGNANPVTGHFAIVTDWVQGRFSGSGSPGTLEYESYVYEGSVPFYLQPEFVLLVLLLWAVIPLLLGGWRFSRSDLE